MPSDRKTLLIRITVLLVAFVLGIIIGYYGKGEHDSPNDHYQMSESELEDILASVDSAKIRSYLKVLTEQPHIAGLGRDEYLTNWIKDQWIESGLDSVDLAEYDFYLSWPNPNKPNKIYLLDTDGGINFTSHHQEEVLREGDAHPNFVHAFNAYAPAGTVEGQLVYVNYGRVEDLQELEKIMGPDFLRGKICLSRYGKIYRGNKVHNCQRNGAVGVILFSDPADVAVQGTEPENVYPNTIFLPGTGVQRGSTYIGDGDPLSPYWASVKNAYRLQPDDVDGLPKIPAQPIGYDDAKRLLHVMGGKESPISWRGSIAGISYYIGGEMKSEFDGWKVKLSVNNYADTVKSSNVIGYIKGVVEPDRYVILSNHRDAWGYGSIDPSSGTAQVMEVVRTLGNLKRSGWRPRRTLIFCSWAAEEYGLEGSYEWVYQHLNKISQRTVGLINTDICVSGPIVKPQASPILHDVVRDALKHASDPTSDLDRSYYDFWREWTNQDNNEPEQKEPIIKPLGSGTDHAAFSFYAGIPAINMRFKDDYKKHKGVGQYPTYHTGYETFYLMDNIIDPGFKIHRTCAQTSIHSLLHMADSALIPYNLNYFPQEMRKSLNAFRQNNITETLLDNGVSLEHLEAAIEELDTAAKRFMLNLEDNDILQDPLKLRMINDQLLQLERTYIMDGGLPDRPDTRHTIFAPGKFNKYGGGGFPAIPDMLYESEKLIKGSEEYNTRWNMIKRHISDLMIIVQSAARFLRPLHDI